VNDVRPQPGPDEAVVQAALREYLDRVDGGEDVDREKFISQYPHIADELRSFIETSDEIRRLVQSQSDRRGPREAADVTTHSFAHRPEETLPPSTASEPRASQSGELPEEFGRYRILRPLGRGAMGTVYLADDTQLGRRVALKTPRFEEDDDGEILQRFYREARVAATLRHPNICPVYDVGDIGGVHYISMAYIEGRLLSSYIVPDDLQPERNVLLVVRKLAGALQEAHDRGIIHRDLKPGNVMVDERGEPIIMDFGLAHQASRESQVRLTQFGMLVGSPAYMSPEQVHGDLEKIGPTTDQYSLGVMLYELLTGRLPFQGSLAAVLGQIVVKRPKPPGELRAGLDPRIEEVCLRMLAKSPRDRFPSMKAVADELGVILKNPRPVEAPRKSVTRSEPAAGERASTAAVASPAAERPAETAAVSESNLESVEAVARKLLNRHDYDQVVQILEQVPEHQRNGTIAALLEKARTLADEVAFLSVEIDEALQRKDGPTALRKAERLLDLKPRSQRAAEVRELVARFSGGRVARLAGGLASSGRRIGEGNWIAWGAIAFGFVIFAAMFGAVVMYLRVGDAVVRVEINDPGIKVGLQGRTLTIESARDPIKVRSGDGNQLAIQYGELEFTSESFALMKGENPVVRVQVLDKTIAARFGDLLIGEKPLPGGNAPQDSVDARSVAGIAPRPPTSKPAQKAPGKSAVASTSPPAVPAKELKYRFEEVGRLVGAGGAIWQVAFFPDGKRAVSGGFDECVRMWSILEGKEIRQFRDLKLVLCVAVSRDGTRVAAGNSVGEICVWKAADAELIRRIKVEKNSVTDIDFSPDGRLLLYSGQQIQPGIWDIDDNREIQRIDTGDNWVLSAGFLPDGKRAACGTANGRLLVWDVQTGKTLQTFNQHPSWIRGLAFSSDSRFIASCGVSTLGGMPNRVWNVAEGREAFRLEGHTDAVHSIAMTPDNRQLVTGSFDKTLRLWDAATGAELGRTECDKHVAHALAVSPDGKYVLSGGGVYAVPDKRDVDDKDYALRLWRITTAPADAVAKAAPEKDLVLRGHTSGIQSIAISPDDRWIASCGEDFSVRIWDAATGQTVHQVEEKYSAAAFTPDGKALFLGQGRGSAVKAPVLLQTGTWKEIRQLPARRANTYDAAISGDGTKVLCSYPRGAALWNLTAAKHLRELEDTPESARGVAFTPDGKFAFGSVGFDKFARWEVSSGKLIALSNRPKSDISTLSPDGRAVLVANWGGGLDLLDFETGAKLRNFAVGGRGGSPRSVAFTPDGQSILFGSDDTDVYLVDVSSGQRVKAFSGHTDPVSLIEVSADGKFAVTACADPWDFTASRPRPSKDHTLRIWRLADDGVPPKSSPSAVIVPPPPAGTAAPAGKIIGFKARWSLGGDPNTFGPKIRFLKFSPDSKLVASCWGTAPPKLIDVATGKIVRELTEGSGFGVIFTPDEAAVLHSKPLAGKLGLIDTATGNVRGTKIPFEAGYNDGKFFDGGRRLYFISDDGRSLSLVDWSSGKTDQIKLPYSGKPYRDDITRDGRLFATGIGANATITVFDVESKRAVAKFRAHAAPSWLTSVSFNPQGTLLASSSHEGSVKLWDPRTGDLLAELTHSDWVEEAVFSPDGRFLAAATHVKGFWIWDVERREVLAKLPPLELNGSSVAFSPDGKMLATGSSQHNSPHSPRAANPDGFGEIKLWDLTYKNESPTQTSAR